MNFLAHIYLSGNDDYLKLGNFMADSIKGKKYLDYPSPVQDGIILHRAIDYFTDTHPVFMKSMQRLFPKYGHYSGIIVDIFYDHFLAANWKEYSKTPLNSYVQQFYNLLREHYELLPGKVQYFMPFMIRDNWLLSYSTFEGIEQVLAGLNRRTGRKSGMDNAIEDLKLDYELYAEEFKVFFKDLQDFTAQRLEEIKSNKKG